MPSSHFQNLESELKRLRKHFLPRQLSRYSSSRMAEIQDGVRAYLVLAHATIEEYVEQVVLDVVQTEYSRWQGGNSQCGPVIGAFVSGFYRKAQDVIRNNHGIKAKNLKKLLELVGIDAEDSTQIDQTWLNDMDSFGQLRGGMAHRSGASLTSIIPPADAKRRVDVLLRGLRDLDRRLQRLRS